MIGFHPVTREWSTATGNGIVAVPQIDGTLSTSDADRAGVARDFGNQVHRRPLAVLHPGSAADVAAIVRFGRECGLAVVPRGEGHTVDGQSQIQDGIVVNMAALAGIRATGPDRISVDAGARWSAVLDATLPTGLVPPVLTDYLELSVGGTLSAGGFGGASHHYGCQADNVHDLDVVTRTGELLTCSPSQNAEVFDAVRGSQGEHGIITRATVALVSASDSARRYQLAYHDVGTFLADQRRLIDDRRFGHVDGQAQYVEGSGWRYILQGVTMFTPPDEPDDQVLLHDLAYERGTEQIHTGSFRDFLYRAAPIEAQMRSLGSWQHPHPRCNLLLPGRHAQTIISDVFSGLTPDDIGLGGSILVYPIPTARIAAPNVPKAHDAITVLFGLQRTAPPNQPEILSRLQRVNAALRTMVRDLGGAVYSYPTAHHDALHTISPSGS